MPLTGQPKMADLAWLQELKFAIDEATADALNPDVLDPTSPLRANPGGVSGEDYFQMLAHP
jgi:hypothetical protein